MNSRPIQCVEFFLRNVVCIDTSDGVRRGEEDPVLERYPKVERKRNRKR